MFSAIFFTILRSIAIPIVAFLLLKDTFVGTQLGNGNIFLAITIAITLSNVIFIIFQIFKILPNALLLRGMSIFKLLIRIIIELSSIIGFWLYYFTTYR